MELGGSGARAAGEFGAAELCVGMGMEDTHQRGGSRLLGLLAQMAQHLVHLGQLLGTDVLRVWGQNRIEAAWHPAAGAAEYPVLPPGPAAHCPSLVHHSHVLREKWRFSVAAAAAAMAAGSAWPRRYWMERSWKQGSASSTAVARSALQRERHRQALPVSPCSQTWFWLCPSTMQLACSAGAVPKRMQHGGSPQSSGSPSTHQGSQRAFLLLPLLHHHPIGDLLQDPGSMCCIGICQGCTSGSGAGLRPKRCRVAEAAGTSIAG